MVRLDAIREKLSTISDKARSEGRLVTSKEKALCDRLGSDHEQIKKEAGVPKNLSWGIFKKIRSEMYKIEKSVKAPERRKRGAPMKYPLNDMEEGNSFFVPTDGSRKANRTIQSSIMGSVHYRRKTKRDLEGSFFCKSVGGVRCWREKVN